MTKMIDYEDNVFYLTERTKLIEKGLVLALNPDLFSDRFLKDAEFISGSLLNVRNQIDESPHTLKRSENLRSLMLANQRFLKTIPNLLEMGYLEKSLSQNLIDIHDEQVSDLSSTLENAQEGNTEVELISSQEFEFLLKEEDPSSDIDLD